MIKLMKYNNEKEIMCDLIKKFWIAHNDYSQSFEESFKNLLEWTDNNHALYYIMNDEIIIGFAHLGARGCEIDWLEDLFILPEYQGHGYGSLALKAIEQLVKEYSDSLYMEVAARNANALRFYVRNGYTCLNTITVRKDFTPDRYAVTSNENILGQSFEIKIRQK